MQKQTLYMGEQPIKRLLFNMSMPAIIGMMVHGLYNVVDTVFIGRGVGSIGIAALTIAFPIQIFVMSMAQIVGLGGGSAISRSLGAKNKELADRVTGNAFALIFIISGFVLVMGLIFIDEILLVFGTTEEILPFARDYMEIIFLGVVFIAFSAAVTDIIRAEGNAKVAMATMLLGTLINIILDPIFIFGLEMGMKGAAIATVISQMCSFIVIIIYLFSGRSTLNFSIKYLKLEFTIVKEIVSVGMPAFIRSVGGSLMAVVVNHALVSYGGTAAISAFGIVNRVMIFLFMPILGTIQGMQPIVAYNYGALQFSRIRQVIKLSLIATFAIGLIGLILVEIFPEYLVAIFTKIEERAAMDLIAIPAIRIVLLASPIIGASVIAGAAFESFGKAKPAMFFTLLRQIILLIPLILFLPLLFDMGLFGIWWAFPIADAFAALISLWVLKKELDAQGLIKPSKLAYS